MKLIFSNNFGNNRMPCQLTWISEFRRNGDMLVDWDFTRGRLAAGYLDGNQIDAGSWQ